MAKSSERARHSRSGGGAAGPTASMARRGRTTRRVGGLATVVRASVPGRVVDRAGSRLTPTAGNGRDDYFTGRLGSLDAMAAVKSLGVVVLGACALVAWATMETSAAAQGPGLRLVVLQGQDGENVIGQGAQVPTVVEVRDRNELPVAGASVLFLLGEGGTATLNAGLREVSLTTNALGQAAVMVNPVAVGVVELSVAATFMGETVGVTIVQTNLATAADAEAGVVPVDDPEHAVGGPVAGAGGVAAAAGGGLGTGAILGLAGAGGAVGVSLAVAGGGGDAPAPDPPARVPSRPSAPSVSAGDGLLDVTWSAPASNGAVIDDYDLRHRRSGGTWEDHPGEFLDLRATIEGLENGTTYEVQVRAGNAVGKGDWSPSGTGAPIDPFERERAVLMELYNATDGPNWTHNNNWNSSEPVHRWDGVWEDRDGRVVALYLDSNQLNGSIPPSLGSLVKLESLFLNDNQLSGSIPSSLGNLANLRNLFLNHNQLSGSIPPSLGNLAKLEWLYLENNRLSGSIPSSLGSLANLKFLTVQFNELSGSIPSSLGSLANLRVLEAQFNELSGSIPSSLGGLPNLAAIWLLGNRLTGSIPRALCKFKTMINPQRGDVSLPCEESAAEAGDLARLSVADAEARENVDDTVDFTVTLDRPAVAAVSVDYATADGSARAGADYAATSGTLTLLAGERSKTIRVDLLDDAHDEGVETFTLALSNASGGVIADGQATGRIENHDSLPRALLARFGRTAAVHVVEQVEERLQARRAPGVEGRFAGRELRPGMERDLALSLLGGAAGPVDAASVPGAPRGVGAPGSGRMSPGGRGDVRLGGGLPAGGGFGGLMEPEIGQMAAGGGGRGGIGGGLVGGGGGLLAGSAFAVNRETNRGGVLSFWSRGAQSSFRGREGALELDGDVRTTMFGADYAKGPVVVGLSLANSRGLGRYAAVDAGRVATSVTGFYPWLGYRATDRVTVWGVTGYGAGGLMLTPGGGASLESGLSMAMAAGGTRGELIAGRSGGFGLAFKADALWVGTSVEGVDGPAGRLAAAEAAVTRFRTGLEGSREFLLGGRVSLRPSAEVGLRHDGGDADTGAGMDVGGGLVLADSSTGLAVDIRVRMLVAHQAEGFREQGMAVSLSYDPTPSTPLGFRARVAPSWGGQATGGAEALWGRETMAGLADGGFASGNRLDTELGYGLPVGSRFVGTPRVGLAATEYGRDYRMGYGLTLFERDTLTFEMGVDARRRQSLLQGGADNGFLGQARIGW